MQVGVNVLNFGDYAEPQRLLGWARFAEEHGLGFAMISDHLAITPDVAEQYPAPFYDPFVTLAWLAGQTTRLMLGTTITVVPYRHPLHTARMVANIDRLGAAGFIFGVGVSWPRQEYAALGIDYSRRGRITDEYLDVIQAAWREEVISHAGEFVSFADVATGPLPRRRPLTWVGGASAAALRRAVRVGDAWHPLNLSAEQLTTGVERLRELARERSVTAPGLAPRLPLQLTAAPSGGDRLLGQGTVAQVRGDLEWLRELGATHVVLDTYRGRPDLQRDPERDQADIAAVLG